MCSRSGPSSDVRVAIYASFSSGRGHIQVEAVVLERVAQETCLPEHLVGAPCVGRCRALVAARAHAIGEATRERDPLLERAQRTPEGVLQILAAGGEVARLGVGVA